MNRCTLAPTGRALLCWDRLILRLAFGITALEAA